MKYKYLAEWINNNKNLNIFVKEIKRFEDQFAIFFQKERQFLQINLSSEDSFCFFTESRELPFLSDKRLVIFNAHLSKAKLEKINISDKDRIIILEFSKVDIYNQKQNYLLIIELINRFQNLILTKSDNVIIDCWKKISFAENKQRQILPGAKYMIPDSKYKNILEEIHFPISFDSNLQIIENSQKEDNYNQINLFFEHLYYDGILKRRNEKLKQKKINHLEKQIRKKQKKLKKLKIELADAEEENIWKQKAELLKASFDKIKKGMNSIKLKNYFLEGFPEIEIVLFSEKNAQQNINYYFKKYKKAKNGKKIIARQIAKTENEIEIIKREIQKIDEDFIIEEKSKTKETKREEIKLKKLKVDENWEIIIGRTSRENDLLTTRFAKPHDWWFHTRIFRGTHVILRNFAKKELPENLKIICSRLAAYFSKAKKSSNVPVDYTQIRFVRKPKGSPTGYVVYTNQKTLFVDPLSMREASVIIRSLK